MKKVVITLEIFEPKTEAKSLHEKLQLDYENFKEHEKIVKRNNEQIRIAFLSECNKRINEYKLRYSSELFNVKDSVGICNFSDFKGLIVSLFEYYVPLKSDNTIRFHLPITFKKHTFGNEYFEEYILNESNNILLNEHVREKYSTAKSFNTISDSKFEECVVIKIKQLITKK